MNKGDLVAEVSKIVAGKKAAQQAVDTVFSSIVKALKKKEPVTVVGFGTFKVDKRKARRGGIPRQAKRSRLRQRRFPDSSQAKD